MKIVGKADLKTDLRLRVSDDIELECELSRANGAAAKWFKDGQRVEDDERFCVEEEGVFRSLIILNAETGDSGEYLLDVGDDNVIFRVTVEGKQIQPVMITYVLVAYAFTLKFIELC